MHQVVSLLHRYIEMHGQQNIKKKSNTDSAVERVFPYVI